VDDPHAQPLREDPHLDIKILDVLREADQSAPLLAQTLSQSEEQVRVDNVRLSLVGLASRGLARPSGRVSHQAEMDADEPALLADEAAAPLWEITEEGRAFLEAHAGVALAPYDRGAGHEEEEEAERDVAGLVVLLVIALLTAVCAAYSLLMTAGVLGG
jgi:predicted component of type VI protein secretion system